jgi:hypothetical protein
MTKTQVEVITSVERRRRWSRAEKERIVAAAIEPAVASEVARAAGIDTSQLFRWRRELCGPAPSTAVFSPSDSAWTRSGIDNSADDRKRNRDRACDRRTDADNRTG